MTILNAAAVPAPGPLGRPAHVSPGSLTALPTDPANLPPSELLGPAQLDSISVEVIQFAERLKFVIAEAQARVENERRAAVERYAERDMPSALKASRAKEDSEAHKKKIARGIAPQLAELLTGIRDRVARLDAQAVFYKSPAVLLSAYALQDPALKLMPALQGAGVATLAAYYQRAYAEANTWLGAALLARTGPGAISDEDFGRLQGMGFDKAAVARRLVGEDYAKARDAIRRARTARKDVLAAEYQFRESKPLARYELDAGMEKAGHYSDEFRD